MANEMQPLTLRAAVGEAGPTRPLLDGAVPTGGLRLEYAKVPSMIGAYRQMVRELAFDVCELPIVTYLLARSVGRPFTALPIFLRHGFFHHWLLCRADSAVQGPRDLEGRRVGVRAYTVTPPTWARGILRAEYGVALERVTWLTDDEEHVVQYQAPPNVVAAPAGTTLRELFLRGDLEVGFTANAGIGQVDPALTRPVIPEPEAAAAAWCRRTGIYPFQNVIVVKDTVLAEHPWVGTVLFDAFEQARRAYLQRLERDGPAGPDDAALLRRREVVGDDLLPAGLAANRRALDTIIGFAVDQRILPGAPAVESLFPPGTLDLQ
ncbi:MAG TPA: ABC transporter substrate-binding protein [Chloroflexota bacterium]|nr:ABC transporter substrate-binding protein [Chloroflexota bacterium]